MVLASVMILPVGMSYADNSYGGGMQSSGSQTGMNQTMTNSTGANSTLTMHDNATMTMHTGTNSTMMNNTSSTNGTMTMHTGTNSTMMMNNTSTNMTTLATHTMIMPLEQVKSGVAPKDIQCKQGFTLILKADDGSAACVDPQVAQILIQRGW